VDWLFGALAKLRNATISFFISVRMDWAPTGRNFFKFDILGFLENMSIKFEFH
jgi:hypothetical protein